MVVSCKLLTITSNYLIYMIRKIVFKRYLHNRWAKSVKEYVQTIRNGGQNDKIIR